MRSPLPGHGARQPASHKPVCGKVQVPPQDRRPLRAFVAAAALLALALLQVGQAEAAALRIVAFGDSLTAGLGLPESQAYPAQLEQLLRARGHDVEVVNAGVSGDTTTSGLARLDWTLGDGADGVILELGANDALRGIDPAVARRALDQIIRRLKARRIEVLLVGMRSPPNMGDRYIKTFEAIYPELAEKHGILLYPFIVEGVATRQELNLEDGIHPNAEGVKRIVRQVLPWVEEFIDRIEAKRS